MRTSIECIPCFVRQAAEAIALSVEDPARQEEILRQVVRMLAEAAWSESPPKIAQGLHRLIRSETGTSDPYQAVKERMNRLAVGFLPRCRQLIAEAADAREAVVRLAVAGNLMDSGAKAQIDAKDLPQVFARLWDMPLAGDPQELFLAAEQAGRILFLADNAGEIVFDRLLIEALPTDKVTVAVRGKPVLDDALREDAGFTGLTGLVPVIDNGSDAPGTVLEDCSESFRDHFRQADLIISKGQGNYETLSEVRAPIFFLFTVKCPLVAGQIGTPLGSLVVKRSPAWSAGPAPCPSLSSA